MERFISVNELHHRICNGFISHDGYVNGQWRDVFAEKGITFEDLADPESPYGKMMDAVIQIMESCPSIRNPSRKARRKEKLRERKQQQFVDEINRRKDLIKCVNSTPMSSSEK